MIHLASIHVVNFSLMALMHVCQIDKMKMYALNELPLLPEPSFVYVGEIHRLEMTEPCLGQANHIVCCISHVSLLPL